MPRDVVLCVDDEPSVLAALRRTLRREPYEVRTTPRPAEALEWISEHPVSVVLADQRMPTMTGTELLKNVRLRSPGTSRAMLTAYPDSPGIAEERPDVVQCLISKPWDGEELKQTLRELLVDRAETRRIEPPPAHGIVRDFRESVVHLDCRDRSIVELMAQIMPSLRRPGAPFGGVALLMEHLRECKNPVADLVAVLAEAVRRCGTRTYVVDRDGMVATIVEKMGDGAPLTARKPKPADGRVLAVAHRDDSLEFFRMLLRTCGVECDTTRWLAEATVRLDTSGFDLVVVDLDVPDAHGLEALTRLRNRAPRARLVPILSGVERADDPALHRLGIDRFIVKPYSVKEALDAIERK